MAPIPEERSVTSELAEIRRRLRELEGRTLENVTVSKGGLAISGTGGITVTDAEGDQTFFVGGVSGVWARPDGAPQSVAIISDDAGRWRIAVWDPDPTSDGYSQQVLIWDALGHVVFATDPAGGLAHPGLAVPMYCRYTPPAGTLGYLNIPVTSLTAAQTIWEGRIYDVVSCFLEISGIWGAATGTNTSTYTLQVAGQTVGSWVATAIETSTLKFDISQWQDFVGLSVRLLVQSTGTGTAAAQINGCTLRGS